jgi:F-type H+-transporting ATPase subunit delta
MSAVNSYAKALYEAAKESKLTPEAFDQLENQMDTFVSLMDSSRDLKTVLDAPIASAREKVEIVEQLAGKLGLEPLLKQFFILLAKKERFPLIKEIRDALIVVRLEQEGGISGRLVAAEPMDETDIQTLAKAFGQKLGKKVAFRVSTDPSLLAGMKVTVNGVTYDGTLRSQLQKLRDRFVAGISGNHA